MELSRQTWMLLIELGDSEAMDIFWSVEHDHHIFSTLYTRGGHLYTD